MGINLNVFFNLGYKLLKLYAKGYNEIALLEGPDSNYEIVTVDYTGVEKIIDSVDLNTAFILFDSGIESFQNN